MYVYHFLINITVRHVIQYSPFRHEKETEPSWLSQRLLGLILETRKN